MDADGGTSMGIFDKVIGGGSENLSPTEGVTGIVLCAVAADGVITQEELQGLGASLSRMRLFRDLNQRQVNANFEKVFKLLKNKGVEELLKQSAAAVPKELRNTAFAVAADLVFADGDVAGSEKKYLEHIQQSLGVADDVAVKVVEVMAIKNKA